MRKVRKILPLYFVVFFAFLGYSLMITVFTPMFLHSEEGLMAMNFSLSARSIFLGILLSLYPLGQFLGSPIAGSLSDQIGRKPVLVISLFLTTIFYAWISIAIATRSMVFLMIGVFLAGFAESNAVIAQNTLSDVTAKRERPRFFGYLYLSIGLAYIAGPLFGGKIAEFFQYETPFWWAFLFLAIMTLWIMLGFKETYIITRQRPQIHYWDSFVNIKNVFIERKIRKYYFANFFIYLAIFGFFRAYPMYLVDQFHLNVGKLAEFVAWVSVPIIFVNLYFSGLFSKKWNPKHMLIGASIFASAFIFLVVLPAKVQALWITLFLSASAIAFSLPSCPALLSSLVSERIQGRVMENNQSLEFAAEAVSGLTAGIIASFFFKLPMIVFAGCALLGAMILLLSHKKERRISTLR